jgi:excisionase family DNA binding protein
MAPHARPPDDRLPNQAGLLTVAQAAERAGVSRWTVAGWIAAGRLPSVLVEGRRWVRPADLAAAQAAAHLGAVVPAWRADPRRAGRRLRALREAAGLTQLDLAAASDLAHETVSRLELGRQSAHPESVRKLARALRVDPAAFVAGEAPGVDAMTVAETAARLGVPPGRVKTWLATGQLPGAKASGRWRVPAAAVAALEASGRLRGRWRRLDPRFRG